MEVTASYAEVDDTAQESEWPGTAEATEQSVLIFKATQVRSHVMAVVHADVVSVLCRSRRVHSRGT